MFVGHGLHTVLHDVVGSPASVRAHLERNHGSVRLKRILFLRNLFYLAQRLHHFL